MLTVFVQEVVLDVLAEESLYGLADLLLLLQDVLVILSVVSLGDGWEHRETPSAELKLNFLIVSKLACWVEVQLERHYTGFLHPFFYAFQFKDSSRTFHAQFPEIQGPITFNDPTSIYVYFQLLSRTAPPPFKLSRISRTCWKAYYIIWNKLVFPRSAIFSSVCSIYCPLAALCCKSIQHVFLQLVGQDVKCVKRNGNMMVSLVNNNV